MPITGTAIPVPDPTIPYDKRAVSLSIRPMSVGSLVLFSWTAQILAYRTLSSGMVDFKPGSIGELSGSDIYADAADDADLAAALAVIEPALQAFVTAKGL